MRIIIVGAGDRGRILAQQLEKTRHDIVIVDKNREVVESITDRCSVNGVCGSGASREVLMQAGADTADILISLTPVDEINLLACSMAKSLGTRRVAASLDRDDLAGDSGFLSERFGIDYVLTPKKLVAEAIAEQIFFNAASRVETLFDSKLLLAELVVEKGQLLAGSRLSELKPRMESDFLVCGVARGNQLLVPRGDFTLEPGDVVGIVAEREEMIRLLTRAELVRKPVRSVMLTGGGETSAILTERLLRRHIAVTLVENRRARCEELFEMLPGAKVIYGNGAEVELLEQEGIAKADACICMTGKDETNLLTSLVAWTNGVSNIITKIDGDSYEKVLRKVTISIAVSPDRLVAGHLMDYILSSVEGRMTRYCQLGPQLARISALRVPEDFPRIKLPLSSEKMRVKKGMLIGAILRSGKVMIPKGSDFLLAGDRIFVFSDGPEELGTLADIFNV